MENEDLYPIQDFDNTQIDVSDNDILMSSLLLSSGSDFSGYSLDTFDRIVSGIPYYFGYYGIINESDAYLYYGSEASINDSNVYFGLDCKEVHIYVDESDVFQFEMLSAPGSSFVLDTSKICYTNLASGFPTLGDLELSLPGITIVGLLASFIVIVFTRTSRR